MKKLALLIFIALLSNEVIYAQSNSLYILGTPNICPDDEIGVYDGFGKKCFVSKLIGAYPVTIYLFGSKNINYEITLMHYNFTEKTDNPVMLDMAISSLENLDNLIQAEELLKFKDSDSAYKWMLEQLDNKTKLYIIDTNNFYKSDPTLTEPDRMKVFEVRVFYEWIPDHILNPGDWGFGS